MESLSEIAVNGATAVLWRRLPYMLSPQLDIYERLPSLLGSHMTILEVGFGTGVGVVQYASSVNWVDAIEIDAPAVRFARHLFPLRNVKWMHEDILNPSVDLDHYDFAVMIEVLEHIANPVLALAMLAGLAKQALITVPNSFRYRHKEEALNEQEWTPITFIRELQAHFRKVILLDFGFHEVDDLGTRETPIIALCSSAS